ncbi:MAG: hypothetical protein P8Y66_04120 [Nitrospirota bacterium]|jgi:hypothetical protein
MHFEQVTTEVMLVGLTLVPPRVFSAMVLVTLATCILSPAALRRMLVRLEEGAR